jgi:chromosome segregation ATPase
MSDTPRTNEFLRADCMDIEHLAEFTKGLERENAELRAYADKLAQGLPDGMLPKDVENLRDANLAFANENAELKEWVKVFEQRPERLVAENAELKGKLAELEVELKAAEQMRDDARYDRQQMRDARDTLAAENARLREAAQAVIERWESPAWKDAEPTAAVICRLRDVLWPKNTSAEGEG